MLEGEAGIGKTTLLGGFARAVRDSGSAAVLYGVCQGGRAVPSEPFRSLLEHLIEHVPADVLRAHASRCGALATDRGFLHRGSVPYAQVAIIESALEVIGKDDAA